MAADKLDKSIVLYMTSDEIGNDAGAQCDQCKFFIGKSGQVGSCTVVTGRISGPKGVCGLYVNGKPQPSGTPGKLSQEAASYGNVGPTHCGNCRFYGGDSKSGPCKIVKGTVEYHGCCNAFEREERREWRI